MFRWILVCLLLSATAVGLVWVATPKIDAQVGGAENSGGPEKPATPSQSPEQPAPSLLPSSQRLTIELREFGKPQPGETFAEAVIIPNGHVIIGEEQEVPSEKEGKILFIGTDVGPNEIVPPDKQLPDAQLGILAIPDEAPLSTDKAFESGGVRYRQIRETDALEPNKIMLFKESRPVRKLKVGDRVKRGQLLALVNPAKSFDDVAIKVAKLDGAEHDRRVSQAFKDEFRAKYESMLEQNRRATGSAPKEQIRETQLQIKRYGQEEMAKEKKIIEAQRELSAALTDLKMHEIRAAIDGTVKAIYKNSQGDAVKPLEAIMKIQDTSNLRVDGLLDVQEALKLKEGMKVIVEANRPEAPHLILSGHLGAVTCVAISKGKPPVIVSGSDDETLRGWDSVTGAQLWMLEGLQSAVRAAACTPPKSKRNLVLFGCADGTARLLDLDKIAAHEKPRDLAERHQGAINAVAFSPDGEVCATGSDDHTICLWRTETGELLHRLAPLHRSGVTSVQFASAKRLVSADRNRLIVWDIETGRAVQTDLEGRGGDVAQLGVSPDGEVVLFDQGRELRLLSLANKQIKGTLQNPTSEMNFSTMALFSPDGKSILTNGPAPGKLQLWRTPTHGRASELRQFVWTKGTATCGAFAPEDALLATGTQDRQVLVWTMPEKKEVESELKGELVLVEKQLDTQSRQVRVWAKLNETPSWLIPGSHATMIVPPQK